ncbi:hypothetical protein KGF56_001304 [Candida oxycetoniae]|uniref:Ribosome biogenesis protein NOP53 n=1 Tax=Candida oxycetoniae TaxID=497107 RepID=A0AAI9SYS4_9ASCO|nr:uncharacterized protein KGF56_001304 [Candida oxycetoniae]KAI3405698.2 hypothetical protein KGF56_001304 [Candida oxycetoniae]
MSEVKAKRQTSRKGKKAWRKNVDIQDIESKLQDIRDEEIVKDRNLEEEDFIIDTTPSTQSVSIKAPKKLKTHEILANKSKVPALLNNRTKNYHGKIQGVKKTEMLRLIRMRGGKYKDENIEMNRVERDGLINGGNKGNEDLWGDEGDSEEPKRKTPKFNKSTAEVTKATTVPKTLREKPIQITKNELIEKVVHPGKSYNPSLESWKDLINQEYGIEYKRELNRQAMEEHESRIRELMVILKDDMLSDDDDDEDEDDENENENENRQEGGGEKEVVGCVEENYSLSVNKPNKLKIKTRTKRNKEVRHKQRVQIEMEIKDLKKQLKDLSNLDTILQKQQEKEKQEASKTTGPLSKKQRSEKKNKLFKYTPVEVPLELKLSDELTSNLKNLKPEGNLLYDQMLTLQSSGKIEARVPVNRKRKYAKKVTEKWTYKDFK